MMLPTQTRLLQHLFIQLCVCRLERQLRSKQASLPAEPPADDAEAINLMVGLGARAFGEAGYGHTCLDVAHSQVEQTDAICGQAARDLRQSARKGYVHVGAAGWFLRRMFTLQPTAACCPTVCRCACRRAGAAPADSAAPTRCRQGLGGKAVR